MVVELVTFMLYYTQIEDGHTATFRTDRKLCGLFCARQIVKLSATLYQRKPQMGFYSLKPF